MNTSIPHKILAIIIWCCFSLSLVNYQDLDIDNFERFINENDLTFVFAFKPKCSSCQRALDFQKDLLKELGALESEIGFGMINTNKFNSPLTSIKMTIFPTFRIYKNIDCFVEFVGPIAKEEILNWILSILSNPKLPNRLKTQEDLNQFLAHEFALHLKAPSGDHVAISKLRILQQLMPSVPIYYGFENDTLIDERFARVPKRYQFTVHRIFDDGSKTVSSDTLFKFEIMAKLAAELSESSFQRINEREIIKILKHQIPTMFYFDVDLDSEIAQNFKGLALKNYRDFKFLISDLTETNSKPTAYMFDIKKSHFPAVAILDFSSGKFIKHRLIRVNQEDVSNFYDKFIRGELPEFQKSEEIPIQRDPNILTIVWNNYDLVLNSKDSVFLAFISDRCEYCSELINAIFMAAEKLMPEKNLKFGFINVDRNDVPRNINLTNLPIAYLYKSLNKHNPVKYELVRSAKTIMHFIERELNSNFFNDMIPIEVLNANARQMRNTINEFKKRNPSSSPANQTQDSPSFDNVDEADL